LKSYLEINDYDNKFYIFREGSLGAFKVHGTIYIVNPSEVLANDDYIDIKISTNNKITDQAYTKILSNSNIKIKIDISGNFSYIPHPILFYNKANAEINNEFHVMDKAVIIESYILGRKGYGEIFREGEIKSITKIFSNNKLKVFDIFKVKNEEYRNINLMGKECMITIYKVENDEIDVDKSIVSTEEIEKLLKTLVNKLTSSLPSESSGH